MCVPGRLWPGRYLTFEGKGLASTAAYSISLGRVGGGLTSSQADILSTVFSEVMFTTGLAGNNSRRVSTINGQLSYSENFSNFPKNHIISIYLRITEY
jgi:hypothetical protein